MNEDERMQEVQEEAVQQDTGPVLLRQELEAERRALEEQKAAFAAQQLQNSVSRELSSRGLSQAFAPFLTGADEAESLDNVDLFEKLFRESLSKEVTRRMRGSGAPREPARARGYSRETLRGMSAQEINAHWAEISQCISHGL